MDFQRFLTLHHDIPRQGPGSAAITREALGRLGELPAAPAILDVGCGSGGPTLVLARETGGHVTALDIYPPFLARLAAAATAAGLADRITTREGSMFDLEAFPSESFDLIWSEGAIYLIGFGAGLRRWRRLLRPGGRIAVTECTWLTDFPPAEARAFWDENYPDMATEAGNRATAERQGYEVIDTFTLPASAWWDEYYTPLLERMARLRRDHADDPEWAVVFDAQQQEIDLYRHCGDSYGYVFYLMRKTDG